MTRTRARLACALTVPVLLTACGAASSAAAGLEADVAAADAALADARGVGVVLRFEDSDGALVRALQDDGDGMPTGLAELLVGSSLGVEIAARDGRTLAELPEPDLALPEQLRWYDTSVSVTTEVGDLVAYRTVDGDVYLTSDLDELERVAAAAGEPMTLAEDVAAAPAPVRQAYEDVRAGQWLHLPVRELLSTMGELEEDAELPFSGGLPEGLVDELTAAVRPHVQLSDLGSEDGVRRVTVEVDVKALLRSAAVAVQDSLPEGEPAAEELSADALDGLTDDSLQGTLTIEDGHYRSLEVPLAGLVELTDDPSADLPDLGDSALVLELDDAVDAVPVPSRVSDVDLLSLLGGALGGASSDEGLLDEGKAELSAEDEALLACYEEAATEAELLACDETG